MEAISNLTHVDQNLIFRARELGLFKGEILSDNQITSITDSETVPDFIASIKAKLQAKRSINPHNEYELLYNISTLSVS